MEIERLNEHTFKLYISYRDIENRGFDREEIWYDRERGEELFWEMMDEVTTDNDFELEGPLWIQVHAFEKGLEIIVTKAQLSRDGSKLELPISEEKETGISIELRSERQQSKGRKRSLFIKERESLLVKFDEFEDAIQLAHSLDGSHLLTDLYSFEKVYYMYIVFNDDEAELENWKEGITSHILEFATTSKMSIHRLQEYGKEIMKHNALQQLKTHFK